MKHIPISQLYSLVYRSISIESPNADGLLVTGTCGSRISSPGSASAAGWSVLGRPFSLIHKQGVSILRRDVPRHPKLATDEAMQLRAENKRTQGYLLGCRLPTVLNPSVGGKWSNVLYIDRCPINNAFIVQLTATELIPFRFMRGDQWKRLLAVLTYCLTVDWKLKPTKT